MVLSSNDFEHNYAPYNEDQKSYVAVPKPSLNGGLYTGEAFAPGAAYRNFPAPPDSVSLITNNLSSANPPPGAAPAPLRVARAGRGPSLRARSGPAHPTAFGLPHVATVCLSATVAP